MALLRLEVPDSQINDAIDQREWRHALQLIEKREKRLKRDETIDWLTVHTPALALHRCMTDELAGLGL